MHESANKGLESKDSDAEIRESSISRIAVKGYDTSLRREDVDGALREHFASCGNIIHVHVPIDESSGTLCSYALIYVNEEDEEKALSLDGSDMGGRILKIQSYAFHQNHLNEVLDQMKEGELYQPQHTILVTCDDISLRIDVIKTELEKYFSAIGSLVYPDVTASADVYVLGQEGVEKALESSGPSVGGLNFVVTEVVPLPKITPKTGYIHPHNFTIMARKLIENQKKTETTAGNQQKKKSKTTERNQKKKNKKKEKKSKTREAYQMKKKSETREGNQKMKGVEISF
ncbi:hypothetical protein Bca52824_079113 [Brassica carinata]|uniref:RRM domain-containing protein n=1 Tax=Brassica carinata TaxID=52824 RepID=A0A8X7PWR3_BRACI|nr:hypothetical protein Bca52824_079113 [Brassica carinata]